MYLMENNYYFQQADLLLRILPVINRYEAFALKGGTAINFFIRDLPRLSVDIDLTYLPIEERKRSLKNIERNFLEIKDELENKLHLLVSVRISGKIGQITGMLISSGNIRVKIEVNSVIRVTVFPTVQKELKPGAQKIFNKNVRMNCLSLADLYGGKICAALDRQHPRDLFDIKLLLENEKISDEIRLSFIVYLISHNRPISELLKPNELDIKSVFENEFTGMTESDITVTDLLEARDELKIIIHRDLNDAERRFLISFKNMEPDWSLLPVPHIKTLPAVNWKLANLKKMDSNKHKKYLEQLKEILDL